MTDSNRIFVLSLAGGVGLGRALQERPLEIVHAMKSSRFETKPKLISMPSLRRATPISLPSCMTLCRRRLQAYEALKTKAGRLDFLDLLIKARDLLRDNAVVRRELQQRFSHFFVDEFQDTDPLQAEILLLLAADEPQETDWRAVRPIPGKLFLVGDPKQSVYRFRRADVALYEEVKERLRHVGAEVLHLTTSFRSPPSIQSFVNLAFAPAMAAGTGRRPGRLCTARAFKARDPRTADRDRAAGSEALWRLRQSRQLAHR